MKGKLFVEIVNNQVQAQGRIEDKAGDGFWSVRFSGPKGQPDMVRVIGAQQMQAMAMFDTPAEMQTFMEGFFERLKGQQPTPTAPKAVGGLESLSKKALITLAREKGIKSPQKATKADLILALKSVD